MSLDICFIIAVAFLQEHLDFCAMFKTGNTLLTACKITSAVLNDKFIFTISSDNIALACTAPCSSGRSFAKDKVCDAPHAGSGFSWCCQFQDPYESSFDMQCLSMSNLENIR